MPNQSANDYAVDTQAIVRFMENKPASSIDIQNILEAADRGECHIFIPVIVLMEILYLFEKRRITKSIFDIESLLSESTNYTVLPLTLDILKTASKIADVPELHDRLIAATAAHLNIPLLTNDPDLIASQFVVTI
jgi:predicted nucleic acid-binding protein